MVRGAHKVFGLLPRWVPKALKWLAIGIPLLVILNYSVGYHLAESGCDRFPPDNTFGRFDRPIWDANRDWLQDYRREFTQCNELKYAPLVGWKRKDCSGQYINVANGERKSYQQKGSAETTHVFFFGSSVVWGSGARDDHTIPSEFARLAEGKGLNVVVHNRGETAYNAWQSLVKYQLMQSTGQIPPGSIVFFLDTLMEIIPYVIRTPVGHDVHHADEDSRRREFEDPWSLDAWRDRNSAIKVLRRWRAIVRDPFPNIPARRGPPKMGPGQPAKIARIHASAVDVGSRVAESYGTAARWYWLPNIITKKPHPGDKDLLAEFTNLPGWVAVLREFRDNLHPKVNDISDAFDDLEVAVLLDNAHFSEVGNKALAERPLQDVEDLLRQPGDTEAPEPSQTGVEDQSEPL